MVSDLFGMLIPVPDFINGKIQEVLDLEYDVDEDPRRYLIDTFLDFWKNLEESFATRSIMQGALTNVVTSS